MGGGGSRTGRAGVGGDGCGGKRGDGGGGRRERKRDTVSGISAKSPGQAPQPRSPPFGHRFPPRTKKTPPGSVTLIPVPARAEGPGLGKKFLPVAEPGPASRSAAGQGPGGGSGSPRAFADTSSATTTGKRPRCPSPGLLRFFFFIRLDIFFYLFLLLPLHPLVSLPSPPKFPFGFGGKNPGRLRTTGENGREAVRGRAMPAAPGGGGCSRLGAGGGGCRCPVIAALPAARRGTQLAARDPLEV